MRALALVMVTALVGGGGWSVHMSEVAWSRSRGHSALVMVLLMFVAGLQTATPPEDIKGLEQGARFEVAVFAMVGGLGCGTADFVFSMRGVCRVL